MIQIPVSELNIPDNLKIKYILLYGHFVSIRKYGNFPIFIERLFREGYINELLFFGSYEDIIDFLKKLNIKFYTKTDGISPNPDIRYNTKYRIEIDENDKYNLCTDIFLTPKK